MNNGYRLSDAQLEALSKLTSEGRRVAESLPDWDWS